MLEINEVRPFYICKGDGNKKCILSVNGLECHNDCHHTTFEIHAKNKESVDLFTEFFNKFHVIVDDYGRLICTERKK